MVRVNIINPRYLTDQHLMAEYYEILMLASYIKKHPSTKGTQGMPKRYCLGTGHIRFFKDKADYLKKRHEKVIKEMKKRGFRPKLRMRLSSIPKSLRRGWSPRKQDIGIIKRRLAQKISMKPGFYRYYGKHRSKAFLIGLARKAK